MFEKEIPTYQVLFARHWTGTTMILVTKLPDLLTILTLRNLGYTVETYPAPSYEKALEQADAFSKKALSDMILDRLMPTINILMARVGHYQNQAKPLTAELEGIRNLLRYQNELPGIKSRIAQLQEAFARGNCSLEDYLEFATLCRHESLYTKALVGFDRVKGLEKAARLKKKSLHFLAVAQEILADAERLREIPNTVAEMLFGKSPNPYQPYNFWQDFFK